MVLNRTTIYDYLYREIKDTFGTDTISISSVISNTPSFLPAVSINEISAVVDTNNVTLNNDDQQYISTWEVNVYSNFTDYGYSIAQEIMDCVALNFKFLGFIMIMREPLNNLDTTIYRQTARFRRIICAGDEIETGN